MHDKRVTESSNPASGDLDRLSALDFVRLVNREDAGLAAAVAAQEAAIAAAIDLIAERLENGGRLIYIGAGTSGRLGVLDASECPPTFSTDPAQVVGLIAGGDAALRQAIEGAEDLPEAGARDLKAVNVSAADVVTGIAASGQTPYVLGALDAAKKVGAATVGFSCNPGSPVSESADIGIAVAVGPEVLTGSTRLKAGSATKMVLNMLTTGAMAKLGKTFGNLMVDLQASNAKLKRRSLAILRQLTGLGEKAAVELLEQCSGELKTSVVSHQLRIDPAAARDRLAGVGGRLREALQVDDN